MNCKSIKAFTTITESYQKNSYNNKPKHKINKRENNVAPDQKSGPNSQFRAAANSQFTNRVAKY